MLREISDATGIAISDAAADVYTVQFAATVEDSGKAIEATV